VDLSFPVDISIPAQTPTPAIPEIVGRPFDDLLEDGLAQALAAAPGLGAAIPSSAVPVDATTAPGATLPGVEALSAVPSSPVTGHPHPLGAVKTADGAITDLAAPATPAPTDTTALAGDVVAADASATDVGTTDTRGTDLAAPATPAPTDTTDVVAAAGGSPTSGGVALTGSVLTAAGAATAQHVGATSNPETINTTATTDQALAVGSVAPRTLDPARVALTRQITRSPEHSTNSGIGDTETSTDPAGEATNATATAAAADSIDVRQGDEPARHTAEVTAAGAETSHRPSSEGHHGPSDAGPTGSDTFATVATDKVRYLRDLAPAREIQRLAIDLDDARVAVRFADGAATVDVMSDPSSRLDSGWVSNVEKTLRQLDRPVEPMTPGDQSQSQDRRDRDDADSRRQDRPHHEQPEPSIDDERVRRWQDATRALMTTPNTRN
jgi:hypothetical protein